VPAGAIYTDLTSAVSGSTIADGVAAGLLKIYFLGVLSKKLLGISVTGIDLCVCLVV
jgi:hypothetical protein